MPSANTMFCFTMRSVFREIRMARAILEGRSSIRTMSAASIAASEPMLPMAIVQVLICSLAAMVMGLKPTIHILAIPLGLLPTACLYIALGLLLGSLLSEKAVGGICGALMTNLAGWLSGTWFSVEMIGGVFESICRILPFYPSALAAQQLLKGDYAEALPNVGIVTLWAIVAAIAAILVFNLKLKSDQ